MEPSASDSVAATFVKSEERLVQSSATFVDSSWLTVTRGETLAELPGGIAKYCPWLQNTSSGDTAAAVVVGVDIVEDGPGLETVEGGADDWPDPHALRQKAALEMTIDTRALRVSEGAILITSLDPFAMLHAVRISRPKGAPNTQDDAGIPPVCATFAPVSSPICLRLTVLAGYHASALRQANYTASPDHSRGRLT
jgi:hypothetical protein